MVSRKAVRRHTVQVCAGAWMVLAAAVVARAADRPDTAGPAGPPATLVRSDHVELPGRVDSNSPAVRTDGPERGLTIFTSVAGQPSVAEGSRLRSMGAPEPVVLNPWPGGGVWIEAVVPDASGAFYGFYHNERVADACGDTVKVVPRIGMARSDDGGATWTDLGVLLAAPPSTFACDTPNPYNVGGVGDFSVALDHDGTWLYLFFTQYGRDVAQQGVGVARFLWADRDAAAGTLAVWNDGAWLPGDAVAGEVVQAGVASPSAVPLAETDALVSGPDAQGAVASYGGASAIFPTTLPWHAGDSVDAFWGPSVHWNTALGLYVMLLNRTRDEAYDQDGIYLSFARSLEDPSGWSAPVRIQAGGRWYPQVIGLGADQGTDKQAGATARFFVGGVSDYLITFSR